MPRTNNPSWWQRIKKSVNDWWGVQKAEYDIQQSISERDSAARDLMSKFDNEMKKVEKEAEFEGLTNPYDIAMAKYARRLDIAENPGKYPELDECWKRVDDGQNDFRFHSSELVDQRQEDSLDKTYANNAKGRGIGAWIGRIFFGRSSAQSREQGVNAYQRYLKETGFADQEIQEIEKLRQAEAEIRAGKVTIDEVLKRENLTKRERGDVIKEALIDAYGERRFEGLAEKQEKIEAFGALAQERASDLKASIPDHDLDAFPMLYDYNKADDVYIRKEENIYTQFTPYDSKLLETPESRIALLRLYMYSKGHSLDEIYAQTDESAKLRADEGVNLVFDLRKSPKEVGKLLQNMGRELAKFPIPDMTSDAAIYNNMREIEFVSGSSNLLSSKIRGTDALAKGYITSFPNTSKMRDRKAYIDTAIEMGMSIDTLGVKGRLDLMREGAFTMSAVGSTFDSDNLSAPQWADAIHYTDCLPFIKREFTPGENLGDGEKFYKNCLEAQQKAILQKTRDEDEAELMERFDDTITQAGVMKMQREVLDGYFKAQEQAQTEPEIDAPEQKTSGSISENDLDDKHAINPSVESAKKNQPNNPVSIKPEQKKDMQMQ